MPNDFDRNRRSEHPVSRRDFLRRTGAGAMSAVTGSLSVAAAEASVARPALRRLGRTNLSVSEIALGGGSLNLSRVDILHAALDSGITLWDTAPGYGEGASEDAIGRVLAERSARGRIVLMTKEPGLDHEFLATQPDVVAERALTAGVEASLRRLRTDVIDVFVCRAGAEWDADVPLAYPQLIRAVDRLKRSGKIRFTAVSTHTDYRAVSESAIVGGFFDTVMTVLNLPTLEPAIGSQVNALQDARNRMLRERAERDAVRPALVCRGPRAKLRRRMQDAPPAEDMSAIPELARRHDVGLVAVKAANTRFVPPELDERILASFGKPGLSRHQSLYRYVLDRREVGSVAVGMQTMDHLRDALAVCG